jgi:hypothetical protein
MNVSELPPYINFLDSHLKLKVLEFYISKGNNKQSKDIYKEVLFKTGLEKQQTELLKKHNLDESNTVNEIKDKLKISENELKQHIVGYLNLIQNCKTQNNYDTSTSMNKKIVFIFKLDG